MLCYQHNPNFGTICTNRCPERLTCSKKRIPFLIEALDVLASDLETGQENGVPFTSFKSYCIAPEAYINSIVFSMLDKEYPPLSIVPCIVCGKSVLMTDAQREDFSTNHYTKYNKITIAYCSKDCQEKHLKKLAEAKNVASGSLKNHEFALVINGADVTKRPKEDCKYIVASTKTELRARCLFEKLLSVRRRGKRQYLTTIEVREFLLEELPDNIKIKRNNARQATHDVIKQCKVFFPESISLNQSERNYLEIELLI